MDVICQAVSHLWILTQTAPSSRIPEEYPLILQVSAQGISFLWNLFWQALHPPLWVPFCLFFLSKSRQWLRQKSLDFFPAFNQVPWQCENSYYNIVVLKETIYSGYTESLWRLHGAPCFMLCAHMVGNCSLLDPQTTAYGRWRAEPSYGLSIRVWMCPLGRGMLIYLFLFLNPLLHLGAINHPFAGKNKLNVLQWVYLAIEVKIEEDYCTGNLFAFQNVT